MARRFNEDEVTRLLGRSVTALRDAVVPAGTAGRVVGAVQYPGDHVEDGFFAVVLWKVDTCYVREAYGQTALHRELELAGNGLMGWYDTE